MRSVADAPMQTLQLCTINNFSLFNKPQLLTYAPLLAIPPTLYLNQNITNVTDFLDLAACGFLNGTAGLNETVSIYRICSQVH